ncbi:unnamed protein product [Prorocentrum cordatum]|uniref:Uncharacterized protein n=1 Tax=Prorocentrum cordatum TaxID=2364126 RepID=A0ABN9U3E7_9DINO|nr:unnamed protein product [Polarella glacialis]
MRGGRRAALAVLLPWLPTAEELRRLTIVNGCNTEPIWIAHLANTGVGPGAQNSKIEPGASFSFGPDVTDGLEGARYWPKMGCDENGDHCSLGGSGGPSQACVINGDDYSNCAPPVDTKFEATWGREGEPCDASNPATMAGCDSVDVSLVDGWTLPFKLEVKSGVCTAAGEKTVSQIDCSGLTLDQCPANEDFGGGNGAVSMQAVNPSSGQQAGCYGPCLKLIDDKWGNAFATGRSREDPDVVPYCCTTPPMDSETCNAGPIKDSKYLDTVHRLCPGVYGFAYDDGMGLLRCTYGEYVVTFFCPGAGAVKLWLLPGCGSRVLSAESRCIRIQMQAAAPVLAQVAGYAVGWWSSGGHRCICSCEVSGSVDRDIIGVLQRQLDRRGPDQLTSPPPTTCHCDAGATWLGTAAGFAVGVVVGVLLCLVVYFRAAARRPDDYTSASAELAAITDSGSPPVREEDFVDAAEILACGPKGGTPVKLYGKHLFKMEHRSNNHYSDYMAEGLKLADEWVSEGGGGPAPPTGAGPLAPLADVDMERNPATKWVTLESMFGYAAGDPIDVVGQPFLRSGDRGVLELADGPIAVGIADTAVTGLTPRAGPLDIRLLGTSSDTAFVRQSFAQRAQLLETGDNQKWTAQGPPTTRWVCLAHVEGNATPKQRHFWWRQVLGLVSTDPGVEEHSFLCELIETAVVRDGRRFQLWEEFYAEALRIAEAGDHGDDLDERRLFLGNHRSKGLAMVSPESCVEGLLELCSRAHVDSDSCVHKRGGYVRALRLPAMDVNLGKGGADYGHFLGELYNLGAIEVRESPREVCGLFFVPRKDGRLRLIWGTRRSNARSEVLPFTALPSGEALVALEIDESIAGQRTVAPSADVEVCFYQYELPSKFRPFFALQSVDLRFLPRHVRDQVSQQAHMSLLKDVRPLDSWVLDKVPAEPISDPHLAKILYIDNFASIGPTRARPDAATADMITSLADAGVKADMDPSSGTFGVHDLLGFSLVEHRGFTGTEMERLLGHLVSCFMLRRELLSLLRASYTFAQETKLRRVPLWPSVRKELRWCRALLPLVTADMSRPWSPLITSYDASPWGYGVCEASVSASQSGQIGRLSDRSRWKGLLATNRRPRDDLMGLGDVDDDFKIPRDRGTILSADAVSGFTEVDPEFLRNAAWVTVAARPSFGALVAAGDPTGSSAATQPQSDVPLAWPRASASARRRGSGLREQRHHVELQRLLHCLVPRLAGLQANRIREATQLAYLGILEQLAFFMQCRELPRFSAKVWSTSSRADTTMATQGRQAAYAIAAKLLDYGQERAALGCLVMFETYCRVGELLALRMFQIVPPDRHSGGAAGCPTIVLNASELQVPSKTGEMDSSIAFDLPEHRWVGMLLVLLKEAFASQPMEHVVNVSCAVFLSLLDRSAHDLGVQVLQPTPHCFRHGGASHDRAAGRRPLQEVQRRGMWKAHSSVARYDKHGRAALHQALRPGNRLRLFLELFAGPGELTASMRRKGMAVLAFDVNQGAQGSLKVFRTSRAATWRPCSNPMCSLQELSVCSNLLPHVIFQEDAVPGEPCFKAVRWAIEHGFAEHPEWYPRLSASSPEAAFQAHLAELGEGGCARPCAEPAGGPDPGSVGAAVPPASEVPEVPEGFRRVFCRYTRLLSLGLVVAFRLQPAMSFNDNITILKEGAFPLCGVFCAECSCNGGPQFALSAKFCCLSVGIGFKAAVAAAVAAYGAGQATDGSKGAQAAAALAAAGVTDMVDDSQFDVNFTEGCWTEDRPWLLRDRGEADLLLRGGAAPPWQGSGDIGCACCGMRCMDGDAEAREPAGGYERLAGPAQQTM